MANSCGGFVDSFTDTGVRPVLHLPLGTSLYYHTRGAAVKCGICEDTKNSKKFFLTNQLGESIIFSANYGEFVFFYVFGICGAFVEIGSMALTTALEVW